MAGVQQADVTGDRPVRIGIVGFGNGGNFFHAPFIEAAEGVELAGVVARSEKNRATLAERFPGVPVYDSLAHLAEGERAGKGLDAVTITTPPATRHDLVLEAIGLGLAVVADKPFAPDPTGARELEQAAERAGITLSVYQNRRWDSDFVTLQRLVEEGRLGRVTRFHSRMDHARGSAPKGGPAGGVLHDLGTHLIDQAVRLFGPVTRVYATLDWIDAPGGETDAAFVVSLTHDSGVVSNVSSTKLNHYNERELRVYGERGTYVSRSTDVQASAATTGGRPASDRAAWGYEPESAWGTLFTADRPQTVPSEQGDYTRYYEQFARAVRGEGPLPVTPAEATHVLAVIDAAIRSARSGEAIDVTRQA